MNFPAIRPSQYALLHAEVSTGIVLALDGKRDLGAGDVFVVFDSLDDLERYALSATGVRPDVDEAWRASRQIVSRRPWRPNARRRKLDSTTAPTSPMASRHRRSAARTPAARKGSTVSASSS